MAKSANYHVPFRRRREGKTNFHRRKRLLRSDKSRLVVRRSNKNERVSIVNAKIVGDETLVIATSYHLKDYGWKGATGNTPSSYLTGYLAGSYAKALGIKEAILDIGVNSCRKSTRVSAMLCGAVAAGLNIPHDPEVFPPEERYTGQTIADFATKLKKENSEKYDKQFGDYKKRSAKPESLPTYFNATIKAINAELASGAMKTKLNNRNKKNKASKTKKPAVKKTAPPAKKPTTTTPKPATTTPKPTTTKKPATPSTPSKKPTTTTKPASTTDKPKTDLKKSTETPKPTTTKKPAAATTTKTTPKKSTTTPTKKPAVSAEKKTTTKTASKTSAAKKPTSTKSKK
ncbi:MAG: 50S ribosomal protein L18 [Candidatus Heimdallarchaeota archaeon]|nr:50S ribosomal protein L18 [Candidatus Heimdallarchaeota archaeon]